MKKASELIEGLVLVIREQAKRNAPQNSAPLQKNTILKIRIIPKCREATEWLGFSDSLTQSYLEVVLPFYEDIELEKCYPRPAVSDKSSIAKAEIFSNPGFATTKPEPSIWARVLVKIDGDGWETSYDYTDILCNVLRYNLGVDDFIVD